VWGGWARVFLRSKPGRRSEGQWEGEAKGVYSGYCRERARARPAAGGSVSRGSPRAPRPPPPDVARGRRRAE
jgi:hypothetical protein